MQAVEAKVAKQVQYRLNIGMHVARLLLLRLSFVNSWLWGFQSTRCYNSLNLDIHYYSGLY